MIDLASEYSTSMVLNNARVPSVTMIAGILA